MDHERRLVLETSEATPNELLREREKCLAKLVRRLEIAKGPA